jgi:hypothetical protein
MISIILGNFHLKGDSGILRRWEEKPVHDMKSHSVFGSTLDSGSRNPWVKWVFDGQ